MAVVCQFARTRRRDSLRYAAEIRERALERLTDMRQCPRRTCLAASVAHATSMRHRVSAGSF